MNTASQMNHAPNNNAGQKIPAGGIPASPATKDEGIDHGASNPAKLKDVNVQTGKHVETGHIKTPGEVELTEKEKRKEAAKNAKPGKYILRVKAKHPARKFQLGRHGIGPQFQSFDLNQAEASELKMEGPQAWLEVGDAAKLKADAKLYAEFDSKKIDSEEI